MKKIDIIEAMASSKDITKKAATENVDFVLDAIHDALVKGDEVDIYSFFKMSTVHKDASVARNPKDGSTVNVSEKDVPKCKFSSKFKKEINA